MKNRNNINRGEYVKLAFSFFNCIMNIANRKITSPRSGLKRAKRKMNYLRKHVVYSIHTRSACVFSSIIVDIIQFMRLS